MRKTTKTSKPRARKLPLIPAEPPKPPAGNLMAVMLANSPVSPHKPWMAGGQPIVVRCTMFAGAVFQLLMPTDLNAPLMEHRNETLVVPGREAVRRKTSYVRAILYSGVAVPGRLPDEWQQFTTPRVVWLGLNLSVRDALVEHLGGCVANKVVRFCRDHHGRQSDKKPRAYSIRTTGRGIDTCCTLEVADEPLRRTPELNDLVRQAAGLLTVDRLPGKP